jgi:DNA polymerase-3 subunit gamma/tau
MLSNQAFNALLKTLEEPPEHVKFIFATTEIRKVPVTVLSRCQRFDLRRVDQAVLAEHFGRIAEREGGAIEPGALALVARAADGSVRDGLSLLDQAIAHGDGTVSEDQVRDMLGLADRTMVFDLFEAVMKGDIAAALDLLAGQYALGADPMVVLQDLLDLTHWLTRMKAVKGSADDPAVPEAERTRGQTMSAALSMASLTRAWQMLLKGLGEARMAHDPLQAVEMALIRLAYAADLPPPGDVVAKLSGGGGGAGSGGSGGGGGGGSAPAGPTGQGGRADSAPVGRPQAVSPAAPPAVADMPASFRAVADLARERREARLAKHLVHDVHLVSFEPGRIEFNPREEAPRDLAGRLGAALQAWTGRRWVVSVSDRAGEPTLHDQEQTSVMADPLVRAVLEAFPDARIGQVRARAAEQAASSAVPGGDDDAALADGAEAGPDGGFLVMSDDDDDAPAFGGLDDGFGDTDT